MQNDPLTEYKGRLDSRRAAMQRYDELDRLIALFRLTIAAIFVFCLWLVFGRGMLPGWAALAPVAAFAGLMIYQDRVQRSRARAERAVRFYEQGIARIENRWVGTGRQGEALKDDAHLYAADLDVFGSGSLFELLCTARTSAGEQTLGRWLCAPATPVEVRRRQEAVDELRGMLDLREDLAILGDDVRSAIRPQLTRWSMEPILLWSPAVRVLAPILAVLNIFAILDIYVFESGYPTGVVLLLSMGVGLFFRKRVLTVIGAVEEPQRELEVLGHALARLEKEQFGAAKLRELRASMETEGYPASHQIRSLLRLIVLIDSRRNQFFLPLSAFLMWATQLAFAVEAWRRRSGASVPEWLAAVGEFEALCALAGFAYEHPSYPFPEIVEEGSLILGDELGHPLLAECVTNSLELNAERRMLVVSGSNMSGKSTFLRTLGVNVVLALAGAPVRARRLRVSPVNIGATLRIQDSLQAGTSRFYAEIQRLRQIMDLTAGELPALFLLDEILHGTNSHDRAIGAEAVVRGLIARGAVGLVTTHDLALAKVADSLSPRAQNVHFEDHLEDGKMRFDYKLRQGVVEKSNALELMRVVGLDV